MKKFLFTSLAVIFSLMYVHAQTDTTEVNMFELSLEELMQVNVITASKKAESWFEAPLSTSVLTKAEIRNSGANTIPEALRLLPGVIVREQTNGIYSVHLRGYDFIPPRNSLSYTANHTTLVMIDNRVVFRDFQGGTYWESLPVDLNDVEKIEVIRGPSSALYGPNAVSGVINIITQRAEKEGFSFETDAQAGNFGSLITNGNVHYRKQDLKATVSANFQERERYQSSYYSFFSDEYVDDPATITSLFGQPNVFEATAGERYPTPANAMEKMGVNAFINYELNDRVSFDVSAGLQESEVQKIYVDVIHTPFTTEKSETQYVNFSADVYGFNVQASYLDGYQNTLGVLGWEYDFTNLDLNLEYNWQVNDNISIRPGISQRNVVFDDEVGVENTGQGLINGRHELTTTSFSLRNDFRLWDKLRLIAALRLDSYNYPADNYFAYQLAAVYSPNDEHLLRFVASRANKGSNIIDTYIDFNYLNFNIYKGSKELNLMTTDMYEIGYRAKITRNLQVDIEMFYSIGRDFSNTTVQDSTVVSAESPFGVTNYFHAQNLSVEPQQTGVTLALNYGSSDKFLLKPFVTYQKTMLNNYDYYVTSNLQDSLIDVENEWTPAFFGGFYANYRPVRKLNVNVNAYFFDKQTLYYIYEASDEIDPQIILNAKVSYFPFPKLSLYFNIRNLNMSGSNNQFAFADEIKPLYLFGLHLNL